jgi:hypothetical protein
MKLYIFRAVPLPIISLFTVNSAMVYYVCHTGLKTAFEQEYVLLESCLQTCMTYTSAECTVNKLMMGRGTARNMWSFMLE